MMIVHSLGEDFFTTYPLRGMYFRGPPAWRPCSILVLVLTSGDYSYLLIILVLACLSSSLLCLS